MKSMKKLVLVGLVLLASVMVLVGCENAAGTGSSAEIITSEIGQVLTFSADKEQILTVKTSNYTLHESLEYAVGNGDWQQLEDEKKIPFGGDVGSLRMRGKSSEGMATGNNSYARITFGNDGVKVSCTGDIRTLIDYENPTKVDTSNAKFCKMFDDCKNLTRAPALPATELASQCYSFMFQNCTSLTRAPALPATELASQCYNNMFDGCTSLTRAPELPATVLTPRCYEYMFQNCTSLNSVTMLATDISAEKCLYGWLSGVAGSGTFTKASEMEGLPQGSSGIPPDWTVINK